MSIHIGKLVQKEVELQRLTHKEFGALIHRNEKTIPDIYDRASMSIDLLVTISVALQKDFLQVYYTDESMKRLRNDEVAHLNIQIQKLTEEMKLLQKELALIRDINEAQKEIIAFAKEQIRVNDLLSKMAGNTSGESENMR